MVTETEDATVSVLLSCANWSPRRRRSRSAFVGSLRLVAAYGPFRDASAAVVNGKYGGHDASPAWTSSSCQGALGVGCFHVSPVEGSDRKFTSDPLTGTERADLEHFAGRSAARHGRGASAKLTS